MSTLDEKPESMSQELDDYDGAWIAVRGRRVVAHAPDEEGLRRQPAVREGDLLFPIGEPQVGFYMINV